MRRILYAPATGAGFVAAALITSNVPWLKIPWPNVSATMSSQLAVA
jgi:hypothetical protein